jgi:hypothetical protein
MLPQRVRRRPLQGHYAGSAAELLWPRNGPRPGRARRFERRGGSASAAPARRLARESRSAVSASLTPSMRTSPLPQPGEIMNTQLPQCIPATLHCTPIEPCATINPPCHQALPNTHVAATSCPPATVCPQPTTLCPPVGPTGVQHCTAAPPVCGHTQWHGCPAPGPGGGTIVGPTGVWHCTAAPPLCGSTGWPGCPAPGGGGGTIGPTGVWHCTAAPPLCGHTQWHGCPLGPTGFHGCPPPIGAFPAPHGQALGAAAPAAAGLVGPTGVYHCTSAPAVCGHTGWPGCPIGQTGVYHCTSTPGACGHTGWPGCPIGQTGVFHCTSTPGACGHTGWPGCPGTAATVCTQFNC